jgi:hypothetical protein
MDIFEVHSNAASLDELAAVVAIAGCTPQRATDVELIVIEQAKMQSLCRGLPDSRRSAGHNRYFTDLLHQKASMDAIYRVVTSIVEPTRS